jgi:hypothetical protein
MPARPIDSISYSGDAPIVVVGGVNDPATPIRWATEMTAALGSSATMVTDSGEGHGQLLASKCVTAIEAALLTDLTSPDDGTVCAPDPDIEEPTSWSSIPQPEGVDSATDSPEINAALGVTTTDLCSDQQPLPDTEQAL